MNTINGLNLRFGSRLNVPRPFSREFCFFPGRSQRNLLKLIMLIYLSNDLIALILSYFHNSPKENLKNWSNLRLACSTLEKIVSSTFPFGFAANTLIKKCCMNGKTNAVKFLLRLKQVDPSGRKNYAIRRASLNGHHYVVQLLLQDKRVDPCAKKN